MGSENSDIVILDSESVVPTTSSHKQLCLSAPVVTSDSETVQERKKVVTLKALMINKLKYGVTLIGAKQRAFLWKGRS